MHTRALEGKGSDVRPGTHASHRRSTAFVDMRGPMGIAYERSLRFEKPMHTHDRLLLVFPRGGTSMRVRALGDGSEPPLSFTVTSSDGLAVPSLLRHDDSWVTEVYDTFALLPNDALTSRAARRLGIKASVIERVVPFRRSPWLDALLVEYFEDRVLAAASAGPRHSALEELIMMEVLRLVVAVSSPTSSSRPGPSSIVARALRYLEGNLFAGESRSPRVAPRSRVGESRSPRVAPQSRAGESRSPRVTPQSRAGESRSPPRYAEIPQRRDSGRPR